jgi:hypothetical protein
MQANLVEIETDAVLVLVLLTGGSAPTSTKPFTGYPIRMSGLSRHSHQTKKELRTLGWCPRLLAPLRCGIDRERSWLWCFGHPNWPNDSFSRRNRSLRWARWALGVTNRGVSLTTRPRILSIASQPLPFNAAYIVLAPHVFRLRRLKREWP